MAKFLVFQSLIDKLTEYLKLKGEQLKLEVMAQVAKVLAHVITFFLVAFVGLFFGFFIMITLAVFLNDVLDSEYLGYLIVSGALLLKLIIIVMMLRTGKVQRWLEALILKIGENE